MLRLFTSFTHDREQGESLGGAAKVKALIGVHAFAIINPEQ